MPLPAVPSQGTAPPGAGSPASLMGPQDQLPAQPGNSQADQETAGATQLIGDMVMGLEGLARQFPETAADAREVKLLLVKMMQTIVGTQRGPEGPIAPQIMG